MLLPAGLPTVLTWEATNCVVDAACASSLAAMRMAMSELIEGRADMMISGGVDTDNSIGTYMCFSKTPAFSKGENVRTFDKDSDGMMVGEGIGMVLLKRLEDARRDGDRIYAVIKGIWEHPVTGVINQFMLPGRLASPWHCGGPIMKPDLVRPAQWV